MKELTFRTDILPLKDKLFRLALRITMNRQEAEDVVQDTMIKLWNQRERWQDIDSIEAYALTICRNKALDAQDRMGNKTISLESVKQYDRPTDPYRQMFQRERLRQVHDIINQLPEKQRSCMQLRDIEGKQYREIADILQITEDQVKVNIFRARKAIKQRLQDNA